MGKNKIYYTEEKVQFVQDLVSSGNKVTPSVKKMCSHYELDYSEEVCRNYRSKMQIKGVTNNTEVDEILETAKKKQFDTSKKRFIISWGQEDTPIHEKFLTNIEAYAQFIDAEILIIAGRYRNSTSLEGSKQQQKKEKNKNNWHPRIVPYLTASRQNIHEHLTILADVKVSPTASTPLSGFNSITALESCIIGHPRVHLKSLPVLDGYPNKLLLSTGAVTIENYTDSKAGKKGEFNHSLSIIVVEIDGDIFHMRQVQASDNGTFYDLKYRVKKGVVEEYEDKLPAIIFGDVHYGHHDKDVFGISLKMAYDFKAKEVILHDIFDGKSVSHHELNNPILQLQNEITGAGNLKTEIEEIVRFIDRHSTINFITVRSNHDDFLDRWVINTDWRKQPNREMYLKFASLLASGEANKGVIPYILENSCKNVKTLGINDSHRVLGWELAIHGHLGVNGSRGTAVQFKNLNTKNITGHSHSPIREDGHLSVGTLTTMRVGYNNGASSWMNTNIFIYPNAKASHIHIIKGRYTTLL